MNSFDTIIVGSGPAGLGAAFELIQDYKGSILLLEKRSISSGGLRNDCKQNYTFPVGFPSEYWTKEEADASFISTAEILKPKIEEKSNIDVYARRADRLGVELLDIKQAHVGTDKSVKLITDLIEELKASGVNVELKCEVDRVDHNAKKIILGDEKEIAYKNLVIAPGRAGFSWLQSVMESHNISYYDNSVDIGVRIEAKEPHYQIVRDYYDPKFIFPERVRTFCTNSGSAHVVREKYDGYYSVNGHSFSTDNTPNGLVNFAMLKTIELTDPVVSGQQFAQILGQMAMQLSGGQPMMQRIGDFRMGRRSKSETFNDDLYDFRPTLKDATPGDLSLAIPGKILRSIWSSLKKLDTIVPGILHPSTIVYYPEIKTYSNRPAFINRNFEVAPGLFMIGDGAGTSRGITAAWASGIRAAKGIKARPKAV